MKMAGLGRGGAVLLLLLCFGMLTSTSAWDLQSGIGDFILGASTRSAWVSKVLTDARVLLALPGDTAKNAAPECSSLVCPGCLIVSSAAAIAANTDSCTESVESGDSTLQLCGGQSLDSTARQWLGSGRCRQGCTDEAESLCTGHRRMLEEAVSPARTLFAAEAPVSYTSPFRAWRGPAEAPSPGSTAQYTTHWQCGNTQLSAEAYHSLRLNVDNGACKDETATLGIYICGGTVVDSSSYDAVAQGTCSLAPCSASASCSYLSIPSLAPALPPSACPERAYTCGQSGELHVAPDLFVAISVSASCSASSRQDVCVVGSNLVDQDVYLKVKAGDCRQICSGQPSVQCNVAPAPQPLAPSPAPACPGLSYVCGTQTVSADTHDSIQATAACSSPLAGACWAGNSFVDLLLFAAVKSGACREDCPGNSALPCRASAPVAGQPAQAPCSDPSYVCGNDTAVSPELYAAISGGSCGGSLPGSCVLGATVVDQDFFDTVKEGPCRPACDSEEEVPCPARPLSPAPAPAAQEPGCDAKSVTCGFLQDFEIDSAVYAAVLNVSECTTIAGTLCSVQGYLLDQVTWVAVKSGTCKPSCPQSRQPPCPAARAPAAPSQAPAAALCEKEEVVCVGDDVFHLQPVLFRSILASTQSCNMGVCVVGSYVVESRVWDAVKSGSCRSSCLNAVASCPTSPALAPSDIQLRSINSFALTLGEWSECDSDCSEAASYRPLLCRNAVTELPVSLASCGHSLADLQDLSQSCGNSSCGGYEWAVEGWSECSAACGEGTRTRNASCVLDGRTVDEDACGAPPPQEETCFLRPCATASWRTSAWSTCSDGTQTRTVSCTGPSGNEEPSEECASLAGYRVADTQPCNLFTCQSDNDCGGHGSCDAPSKTCACASGYTGPSCNIFLGPCNATQAASVPAPSPGPPIAVARLPDLCCATGVVDHRGNCCASGVVAGSASCCPVGSVLDNIGECCPPDKQLDACGTCGGVGKAVDFVGRCCSGDLDAGGFCCPPPLTVDEFGVCGGDSNSGDLQLSLEVPVQGAGETGDNLTATENTYLALLAGALEVSEAQIEMQRSSGSDQTRRRLQETRATRSLQQSSTSQLPLTAVVKPPYASLPFGRAIALVSDRFQAEQATRRSSLTDVLARGVAGNGICEVGELPNTIPNGFGVPGDCLLSFKQVPTTNRGACNGRGTPFYTQGQCNCWVGYSGADCAACTPGYSLQNDICVRTFNSFQGYVIVSPSPPPGVAGASLTMPLSIAVVGIATASAIVSAVVIKRKQARKRKRQGLSTGRGFHSPCREMRGGGLWAFEDPESSTEEQSCKILGSEATSSRTQKSHALNSKPLALLLGWLSDHGINPDKLEGSDGSFAPSSRSGLSSETGLAEVPTRDIVVPVKDTPPKLRRARATIYTASSPEPKPSNNQRQRHITWTQEVEETDKAVVLRSPVKTSPSEIRSRRSYSYSVENVSPEETSVKRKLHPDFSCTSSRASGDDYIAVPEAPNFQPIPEFRPIPSHGLLTDTGATLNTPELGIVETAPADQGRQVPRRARERLRTQANAFWPHMPWEPRRTDTGSSARWIP